MLHYYYYFFIHSDIPLCVASWSSSVLLSESHFLLLTLLQGVFSLQGQWKCGIWLSVWAFRLLFLCFMDQLLGFGLDPLYIYLLMISFFYYSEFSCSQSCRLGSLELDFGAQSNFSIPSWVFLSLELDVDQQSTQHPHMKW